MSWPKKSGPHALSRRVTELTLRVETNRAVLLVPKNKKEKEKMSSLHTKILVSAFQVYKMYLQLDELNFCFQKKEVVLYAI